MNHRVLCLLFTGFEEIETVTPVDLLRRAGVEVVMASLTTDRMVTGRCSIKVKADALLSDVENQQFDLLFIPGGPGIKDVRIDGRTARLAAQFAAGGRLIAAICAAPTVLKDAGLLAGKRFTSHSSVASELPGSLTAERVVEDGNLITSRGAGTALDFSLALVRRLCGEARAAEIARAIMS